MHGGLSPDLQSMEQIRRVMRPTDVPDTGTYQIPHTLVSTQMRMACRATLWPIMVRPRQGHHRLVRKRSRCIIYFRPRCRVAFLTETRYGSNLPGTSGVSPLKGHYSPSTRGWCAYRTVYVRAHICELPYPAFTMRFQCIYCIRRWLTFYLGGRRWIWVLRKASTCNTFLGTKLLRRVR